MVAATVSTYDELSGAVISLCGTFRYRLWRRWNTELPRVLWVMLNPSTADATKNDRTVEKCIRLAKRWGYGGIEIVNLYAFRTAYPIELTDAGYPIGPDNDKTIIAMIDVIRAESGRVVIAWGAHAQVERANWFYDLELSLGAPLYYLVLNQDMSPRHPRFVPESTELKRLEL